MQTSVPFPRSQNRAGAARAPRRRRRWLFIPLILLIIAAIVVWRLRASSTTTTTTTTTTVSQGAIAVNISGSGSVAAARTVDVPFQQAGTITSVDVEVGDQVQAGQTLAQIDASDLQLQLQQAQANLKSAQAKLDQANNGSATPQDLASAEASIQSAKAQLTQTKTAGVTDLQTAQAQLASAQAQLDALKNPSPANLSSAQTQLAQAQTNLQTQRDSLSQAKTSAYNQMQQAVDSLTQAQSKYATAKKNWDYVQATGADPTNPTVTDASGKSKKNKLSDTQSQQYYDTYVQAETSLHSAETSVQQAQVNYDTARQGEAAQVPLLEQQVANAQAQLDALKNPSANDLRQAQAAVTQAQASVTKLQQGGTAANIAQAQASVTQAQANLDSLTAPATAPDIAAAEASLVQAQADVATAQHNLDEATLKAPFDGVVSAVSVVPGGTASSGTAAVTIVDRSKLHIEVNLSETDAAKVQVGQPVTLTFDALPNVTIDGAVATIAPAATTEQNVVTYPVQVEFDPGETPVKVGMSATADIQIQKVDNAILVPSRAIQTSGNTKSVTVLQGAERTPLTVQVTTGVTSNGQTEITSSGGNGAPALKAGDLVSVPSTTTSSTTTSTQNRSNGGFGGFGGAPSP
jgi:HlyD family secretion protein